VAVFILLPSTAQFAPPIGTVSIIYPVPALL